MFPWSMIFRQLINGLQAGAVFALIAIGYSMVYGIISLLNFAHGDVIMVGGYVLWAALSLMHPLLAMVLAVAACTLLGVVIEKAAYKPLRKSPRISLLITAIGVSYLLQNVMQLPIFLGAGKQDVSALKAYLDLPDVQLYMNEAGQVEYMLVQITCPIEEADNAMGEAFGTVISGAALGVMLCEVTDPDAVSAGVETFMVELEDVIAALTQYDSATVEERMAGLTTYGPLANHEGCVGVQVSEDGTMNLLFMFAPDGTQFE